MNIYPYNTKDYENISNWTLGQNKPNSNPIKPNFQKAKMNVSLYVIEDYRKNVAFAVRKNKAKTNPISEKPKMNVNAFSQKDYENETAFRPKKTNPIKANFKRHLFSAKIGNFWFIRLMRRWTKQIRALELFGEKNRLGRGSNLGQTGEICASGATNDFSRSSETPNTPTHFSEEPNFLPKKLRSSAEKAGEYRLFGHLLKLFRNRASNSMRIAEKALNSEKALHSVSLVAHRYNLCYFIFQGWN